MLTTTCVKKWHLRGLWRPFPPDAMAPFRKWSLWILIYILPWFLMVPYQPTVRFYSPSILAGHKKISWIPMFSKWILAECSLPSTGYRRVETNEGCTFWDAVLKTSTSISWLSQLRWVRRRFGCYRPFGGKYQYKRRLLLFAAYIHFSCDNTGSRKRSCCHQSLFPFLKITNRKFSEIFPICCVTFTFTSAAHVCT